VEKGGEIIPKIVGVLLEARPPACAAGHLSARPVLSAVHHLSVGRAKPSTIARTNISAHRRSSGASNTSWAARRWTSRAWAERPWKNCSRRGSSRNVADLYDLTKEHLLALGKGWGEKSARQVVDGIAGSRSIPFERVLFAIGIRHVGETVAKKIARAVQSMERLMGMNKDELTTIDEVGDR
jgi:DNA ligase (NAD+)